MAQVARNTASYYNMGYHVGTTPSFTKCLQQVKDVRMVQLYMASPRTYRPKKKESDDLAEFRRYAERNGIKVIVHASYMINLAQKPTLDAGKFSRKLLIETLNDAAAIGAIGTVLHVGHIHGTDGLLEATENYIQGIKEALSKTPPEALLFIETGAGTGKEIMTSLADLATLLTYLDDTERARIGFILDTCHLYASGEIDFADPIIATNAVKRIEDTLGWRNVKGIHFNDSRTKFGGRSDRHEDLGWGNIGWPGLIAFLKAAAPHVNDQLPIILETKEDVHNGVHYTYPKQIAELKSRLAQ